MPTGVLFGQIIVVLGTVLACLWGATQWTDAALGYQIALGAPWFHIAGLPYYRPWDLFLWWYAYEAYAPRLFVRGGLIAASARVAPSNSGLARKFLRSPALRANVVAPTGAPPPSSGKTCDFAWQSAGICSAGRSCETAFATACFAALTETGMATPLRSVTKVLPSQYHR